MTEIEKNKNQLGLNVFAKKPRLPEPSDEEPQIRLQSDYSNPNRLYLHSYVSSHGDITDKLDLAKIAADFIYLYSWTRLNYFAKP